MSTCVGATAVRNKPTLTGKKMASDLGYNLASQLLAAFLNQRAGALSCGVSMQAEQSAENLLVLAGFNGTTATKMTAKQTGDANALATY